MGKDGNVGLDATARPLHMPPSYADYAEKYGVFDLMQEIAKDLILNTPVDPLARIVEFLESSPTPKIFVYGPLGSGRLELSARIHEKSHSVQLEISEIIEAAVSLETDNGKAAAPFVAAGNTVPNSILIPLVLERISEDDCKRNGYILRGFPETRAQAVALQIAGVLPTHVIFMEGSTVVSATQTIRSRVQHTVTKTVYSKLHNPPSDDIAGDCVPLPNAPSESDIRDSHKKYEQNLTTMRATYDDILVPADSAEPMDVLFENVWKLLTTKKQTAAPWIPRVILCGPVGSRDDIYAQKLATKYDIVHVQLRQLMLQTVQAKSSSSAVLAKAMGKKGNGAYQVPDSVLVGLVQERLSQLDCQTKGWVLTGFPCSASQAQSLKDFGFSGICIFGSFVCGVDAAFPPPMACMYRHNPNRIFFLDTDEEVAVVRVSGRRTDPLTGQTYDMHINPPAPDVRTRLTIHPHDREASIRTRFNCFRQHYADLTAVYGAGGVHVDANDPDENVVMNVIDAHLVHQRQDTIAC